MDRREHKARRRRRWRRAGLVVLGLVGAALAAIWLALPGFIEARLRSELAARGLDDARFELREVSLDGLEIRDVVLPKAGLAIDAIDVRYTLGGLWRGQIDRVEVRGAEWDASAASLRSLARARKPGGGDWSVGRVELDDVSIAAVIGERRRRSRWSGSVVPAAGGFKVDLAGTALGRAVRVAVTPETGGLRASARASLGDRVELEADLVARESGERTELELVARSERLASDSFAVTGAVVRGAAVVRGGAIESLAIAGRAGALTDGALRLSDLGIEARGGAEAFEITAVGTLGIAALAERLGVSIERPEPAALVARAVIRRDREGWFAAIERATAQSRAGAVVAGDTLRLGDVAATIAASGRIAADRIELAIAPGSSLVAGSIEAAAAPLSLRGESGGQVAIEVIEAIALGRASGGDRGGGRWSLAAPRLRARASGLVAAFRGARARVSVDAAASARLDGGTARVIVAPGARVEMTGARVGGARLGPVTLELDGELARESGSPARARLRVAAARPVVVSGPLRARVDRLQLEASAVLDGARPESITAETNIAGAGERGAASIDRLRARLPLVWSRGQGARGRGWLEARGRWSDHRLPRVSGAVRIDRRGWRFTGTAPISDGSSASIVASAPGLGLAGARVAVAAPRAELRGDAGVGALIAELAGVAITGPVGVDLAIAATAAGPRGRAVVELREVEVARASGGLSLTGVRGRVELTDLVALRSAPDQLIRWRSVTVGERQLGLGSVRFQLAGPRAVRVARAALRVGPGLIDTAPFVLDPRRLDLRVDLGLAGVDLETWLPVISGGRVNGRGTIGGHLGLRIRRRPRWSVSIGAGRLVAVGPGRLRFREPETIDALLRDFARADHNSTSLGRLVRQRLIASLVDFDFAELALQFFEGAERPELQIHTRGRGHRIDQVVDLTVNVRGAEELLNQTLRTWLERR